MVLKGYIYHKMWMKLQNINYENMILIYHICRYIMLPLFTSYRKSEICFRYLRMLSRMKAAYIFYFQFSFLENRIINMYVIIHGSVIIHMYSNAVRWTMRVIQFIWKLLNSFHFNVFIFTNTCFIYPLICPWGFQYITSHFTGNVGETIFIST